jgi:hypothetical protein
VRRSVYLSKDQEARLAALRAAGFGIPEIVNAGLNALEGFPAVREVPGDLRVSLTRAARALDAMAAGRVVVLPPAVTPVKKTPHENVLKTVSARG